MTVSVATVRRASGAQQTNHDFHGERISVYTGRQMQMQMQTEQGHYRLSVVVVFIRCQERQRVRSAVTRGLHLPVAVFLPSAMDRRGLAPRNKEALSLVLVTFEFCILQQQQQQPAAQYRQYSTKHQAPVLGAPIQPKTYALL